MSGRLVRLVRHALLVLWAMVLLTLVALVVAARVAPLMGHDVFIIRGGSMRPAIPLGALVIDTPVAARDIRPGDIVTVRLHDTVVVTHRVSRVVDLPAGPYLELWGDANGAPDPALIPAANMVGRVALSIPVAGYVLAMLSQPAGLISALSFLISLFLAISLLDELVPGRRRDDAVPTPVGAAGVPA